MSSKDSNTLYEHLPQNILPGPSFNFEQSVDSIRDLLRDLPKTDQKKSQSELKKPFYLGKEYLSKKKNKRARKKKTFLSRKERIKLNALKLPKDEWNYKSLEPMRTLWKQYIREHFDMTKKAPSCNDQEWGNFSLIAARSELIGAEIEVVRSKVANQVGMAGTVVLETKMTFQIVTPESKLKILLKENSVFEFRIDKLRFIVFGKHLITRPGERSVKKIRSVMTPDL